MRLTSNTSKLEPGCEGHYGCGGAGAGARLGAGPGDEVVNIDLTADELIVRLKEGKIYAPDKVETALHNFFKAEHILQLRELALKEVAAQVERKVETEIPRNVGMRIERFLACISSNDATAKTVIRKTARLANYYNSKWYVLYVQTPLTPIKSLWTSSGI